LGAIVLRERRRSMSEGNEALAHRFHMDIFQQGNLDAADEILSSNFVWHGAFSPGEDQRGPEPPKQVASAVIAAFPDRRLTHEDTVAEGDKVLIRWSMSATHQGEFVGIAPTGRRVTVTGFDLFRIEGGKIAEMWQEADQLGMMQQLGVVPEPGQGGS
jgi:predicted ester cyclase